MSVHYSKKKKNGSAYQLLTCSQSIHTDIALISLTVTIYMAVQAFAPSFWGPLSDTCGRRVTFIGTFVVFLIANIGLAFSKNFATLMVFRAIQAFGSAATISVGGGVLGDITTAKERGGYMAGFSAGKFTYHETEEEKDVTDNFPSTSPHVRPFHGPSHRRYHHRVSRLPRHLLVPLHPR